MSFSHITHGHPRCGLARGLNLKGEGMKGGARKWAVQVIRLTPYHRRCDSTQRRITVDVIPPPAPRQRRLNRVDWFEPHRRRHSGEKNRSDLLKNRYNKGAICMSKRVIYSQISPIGHQFPENPGYDWSSFFAGVSFSCNGTRIPTHYTYERT